MSSLRIYVQLGQDIAFSGVASGKAPRILPTAPYPVVLLATLRKSFGASKVKTKIRKQKRGLVEMWKGIHVSGEGRREGKGSLWSIYTTYVCEMW